MKGFWEIIFGPIEASIPNSSPMAWPSHIRGVIPGSIEALPRPHLHRTATSYIQGVIPGPIEARC